MKSLHFNVGKWKFEYKNYFCISIYSFAHLLICSFFSSCQTNQNQVPVLGSLDSSAIALDTNMQKGFESSYEFHKTLPVNEKLVYDVVGYGGSASQGEFAILKRGADNRPDTVMKGKREGMIGETFLADSNKNQKPEVCIVVQNPAEAISRKTLRFEFEKQ